jgi:hypothetical protein
MYEGAYAAMVDAGIAVQHDEEKMFDVRGNNVTDKSQMYGKPSKFELIHPERLFFVDENWLQHKPKRGRICRWQIICFSIRRIRVRNCWIGY